MYRAVDYSVCDGLDTTPNWDPMFQLEEDGLIFLFALVVLTNNTVAIPKELVLVLEHAELIPIILVINQMFIMVQK